MSDQTNCYMLVGVKYQTNFEDVVNELVRDGWRPIGGIGIGEYNWFYQAMWRDPVTEENEKD